MKITFEVTGVGYGGNGLEVSMREISEWSGERLHATVSVKATEAAKRTYHVGRRVSLELKPL